jgi:hypothetical protein
MLLEQAVRDFERGGVSRAAPTTRVRAVLIGIETKSQSSVLKPPEDCAVRRLITLDVLARPRDD